MFKKGEKLFQIKGWNPGFLEVNSYLNETEQGAKGVHSSKKPVSSLRKALRGHFSVTGHNLVVISVVVLFLPLSDISSPDDSLFYTARYLHRWNKNFPYKNTLKGVLSLLFFNFILFCYSQSPESWEGELLASYWKLSQIDWCSFVLIMQITNYSTPKGDADFMVL